jgi:hypothetical protein
MMKRAILVAVLSTAGLLAMTTPSPAPTWSPSANGVNTQLYEEFGEWCLKAAPDFAALSGRASTFKQLADNTTTQPDGSTVEARQWERLRSAAQFIVGATQITGGGKTATACSVLFPGLQDNKMAEFLSEPSRLGAPLSVAPDKTSADWTGPFPGTQIHLDLRGSGQAFQGMLTLLPVSGK